MMYLLFFSICFGASIIGAICGIGGGVIIKPVLDATGVMNVATVSFLSGCTVLAMTTYSVIKGKISRDSHVELNIGIPLGFGAAVGGLVGKQLFSLISNVTVNKDMVGAVQAICLICVTIGTFLFTIFKKQIRTYHIQGSMLCIVIGLAMGIMSSFLGIGGGPINLVILFFFFSMSTKIAAEYSLYIIFFSQLASLGTYLITDSVPDFSLEILILMVAGGILGGICGRAISKRINERIVNRLFLGIMVIIIGINFYNAYKFIVV